MCHWQAEDQVKKLERERQRLATEGKESESPPEKSQAALVLALLPPVTGPDRTGLSTGAGAWASPGSRARGATVGALEAS